MKEKERKEETYLSLRAKKVRKRRKGRIPPAEDEENSGGPYTAGIEIEGLLSGAKITLGKATTTSRGGGKRIRRYRKRRGGERASIHEATGSRGGTSQKEGKGGGKFSFSTR